MTDDLTSRDPVTGDVIATFPVADEAAVGRAVAAARAAAPWWAGLGAAERGARLVRFGQLLAARRTDLADLIRRETGKGADDARLEVLVAIEHVRWAGKHAAGVLADRRVAPGSAMPHLTASVRRVPYGVVGVIGPWNFPAFTPLGSIAAALAAGNTVVFKPSEHTPAVGQWLAAAVADVVPEDPVLTVVTGAGATGAALVTAGVDKVAFTGSAAVARQVLAAAAPSLTPVVVECGGKDPLLVAADADLDAAADAAAWGGFSSAGQACAGIERVYVVAEVYDAFLTRLVAAAERVRAGADYGAMTTPEQLEVVRAHVIDALDRGARAVVGGLAAIRPPYVDPIVLVDVPQDARAVQEETFGPTLTVTRVPTIDAAIEAANGTPYALGASVFSAADGERIAGRLRAGAIAINGALTFLAVPGLPFGGVGASGYGRVHGADGLREFTRTVAIARRRHSPLDPMTFRRGPRRVAVVASLLGRIRRRW